jgi:GNAT superfamily N-acetyltransferase
VSLVFEVRPYSDPDVVRLVAEVQQEYVRRYGGTDQAPVDPAEFEPPVGLFMVGSLDGEAVTMGGWRRVSADVAEIKRMYVVAGARRQGVARRMLAALEESIADAAIARVVLNTGTEQPEAVALYESSGYQPAAEYGYYAGTARSLFFGKDLRHVSADKDAAPER